MPGGIAPWKLPRAIRLQQVTKMKQEGARTKDIAEALDISLSMAHLYVKDAREAGMLPPRETPTLLRGKDDPPTGSMTLMLSTLPDDVRVWLYSVVPKGGTVAELVAGIIADVYDEELGGE